MVYVKVNRGRVSCSKVFLSSILNVNLCVCPFFCSVFKDLYIDLYSDLGSGSFC